MIGPAPSKIDTVFLVEAINGNIKSLLRPGRGYKNLRYLLLKAQRNGRDQD